MSDFIDRARARASSAQDHIGRLCTKEERWTMSVPPRDDDSDILLTQVAQDAEAAVEALARVRELHRKYGLYELEDACTNTSEEHRQERHHEASDEVGEFYCEDMPIGAVCDECRDEDGERLDWPCATYKAMEE